MKSREAFIRLQRYKADEKRRHVDQIESMIAEFERMARDLDEQVRAEEERSGIRDTGHFAYPTFAKAAIQRRDNLFASTQELREQLRAAQEECDEAVEELRKVEAIVERDHSRLPSRAPDAAACITDGVLLSNRTA
jgi:flagellar export protein FliJ